MHSIYITHTLAAAAANTTHNAAHAAYQQHIYVLVGAARTVRDAYITRATRCAPAHYICVAAALRPCRGRSPLRGAACAQRPHLRARANTYMCYRYGLGPSSTACDPLTHLLGTCCSTLPTVMMPHCMMTTCSTPGSPKALTCIIQADVLARPLCTYWTEWSTSSIIISIRTVVVQGEGPLWVGGRACALHIYNTYTGGGGRQYHT